MEALNTIGETHFEPPELTVRFSPLEVLAFIELAFCASNSQRHLDLVSLPVESERDQSDAFDVGMLGKAQDFTSVEEEFSSRRGRVIGSVPMIILIDVGIVEPDFPILHTCKCVCYLTVTTPERLHLSATQDNSGLERFEYVIIPSGFRICHEIGHCLDPPTGACAVWRSAAEIESAQPPRLRR